MKILKFLSILVIGGMAFLGCQKTEQPNGTDPGNGSGTDPDPVVLTVTPTSVSLSEEEGSYEELSFSVENAVAGEELSVAYDANWLTYEISDASASIGTITLTASSANYTGDTRTATVTVSYESADDVEITVNQYAAGVPMLSVDRDEIIVVAEGSSEAVKVTVTNGNGFSVTASSAEDWIGINYVGDQTSDEVTVVLTVEANESTTSRSTTVTISYEGADDVTITVAQEGATPAPDPELSVDRDNVSVVAEGGLGKKIQTDLMKIKQKSLRSAFKRKSEQHWKKRCITFVWK